MKGALHIVTNCTSFLTQIERLLQQKISELNMPGLELYEEVKFQSLPCWTHTKNTIKGIVYSPGKSVKFIFSHYLHAANRMDKNNQRRNIYIGKKMCHLFCFDFVSLHVESSSLVNLNVLLNLPASNYKLRKYKMDKMNAYLNVLAKLNRTKLSGTIQVVQHSPSSDR